MSNKTLSHILVVEDDENLRLTLVDNLEMEGYSLRSAATIAEAKSLIEGADLCLLDIMLPDGDGYQFCQWVRAQNHSTLILMLTARTLDRDLDEGFESGADDYLGKPYRMKELLLRVQALLRRATKTPGDKPDNNIARINGFKVNWQARLVANPDGQPVHLTKKEFDILQFLYENIDQVQSRDDILNQVWGENSYVDNRTVDNFVANIKRLLDLKAGEFQIRSVRGVGYCLSCGGSDKV